MPFPLLPRRNILSPLYTLVSRSGSTPNDATSNEKELGWKDSTLKPVNGNSRVSLDSSSLDSEQEISDENVHSSEDTPSDEHASSKASNYMDGRSEVNLDSKNRKRKQARISSPPSSPVLSSARIGYDEANTESSPFRLSPVKASQSSLVASSPSPSPVQKRAKVVPAKIQTIVFEFNFCLNWSEAELKNGQKHFNLNRQVDHDAISVWLETQAEADSLDVSIFTCNSQSVILLQELEKFIGYIVGRPMSRIYKHQFSALLETRDILHYADTNEFLSTILSSPKTPSARRTVPESALGNRIQIINWKDVKQLLHDVLTAEGIIVVFM